MGKGGVESASNDVGRQLQRTVSEVSRHAQGAVRLQDMCVFLEAYDQCTALAGLSYEICHGSVRLTRMCTAADAAKRHPHSASELAFRRVHMAHHIPACG